MSLDFSAGPPQGLYPPQQDLDPFSLQQNDLAANPQAHSSAHMHINPHSLDRVDGLDVNEQGTYDIFNAASSAQRYRSNNASSSPLNPGYGLGVDSLYPQGPFADTMASFNGNNNGNGYDMINGLSSSYSSGKPSPLTPNDGLAGLSHSSAFPFNGQSKDFSHPGFQDVLDRRLNNVSNGSYQSDFSDDYNNMGVNPAMGLGFPPSSVQQFQERMGRMQGDARFQSSMVPPLAMTPHMHQNNGADILRGVAPHATHNFRPDGGVSYDDIPQFMAPNPHIDFPLRMPTVDETLSRMRLQTSAAATDLQTFIRPYLDQYVRTPNRLAFGERTVIVMSSKVAQKSYGTEKRFLCPPPTAIMIGNSWWSDVVRRGEEPKQCPPRVIVSISGEPAPQEGSIEWTGTAGKPFDTNDPPTGTTFIGRCVGKQLFISDVDEKKKKVEALVKIMAPASEDEPERVIGTFPSRPIKVISKPSKKRQSAKNLELCINHGSTISCSTASGSDGAGLMGLESRNRTQTPSFIARTASWDPFIVYIVDVNKPAGGVDAPPPPPLQPDYPSPPPNAIPFTNNGSQIPIYYNQTVVLQCLVSGVVSPVLIIRKVDHQTTVVGGGLQEGAKGIADHYCVPGEVCGDPVSQLHKIALEVYDPNRGAPEPGSPGTSGAFLSCMGEKVNTYRPVDGRTWNATQTPASTAREAESPIAAPGSPTATTPTSSTSSADYFNGAGSVSSAPTSPDPSEFPSNDGGRVKKGKRGSSSGGGITKPASQKGRRRPTSAGSAGSGRRGSSSDSNAASGALWQVDIGETSVWTIVGTDQIRYNFYVPPVLFDNQNAPQTGSFPIVAKPVTPFPGVVKYLPPDRASEAPKNHSSAARGMLKPNPHASKMLTVYGENFSKADPVTVFFGSDPSPYVEVRCAEVMGCLPPETPSSKRRPIILVRHDGVVFPSNTYYP
ncbi:LAG1-DNAbind-domain-containing protein [Amylocystis lapponica]|nr:LAG1-DNAbind-domain-containing protein [Amylocystis lapponica]